ncbi:hypothetical protein EIN_462250 [Entamoeba invadens IP1]|uniref:Uncharacterized protein n=1 Tax=Entamoeba invadens IP1 TaxID=370355 RepID=A0A0A1UC86_ENTIV|nr:hypothetical protein EIN_462250 [Entamoeba invadens IP1]ELP89879.1 hypothetical protein EIN_462250 [Entamoeba invadens IP1]|eukprot:XP_004256650.1 hypothetical protein EIN_462250 [Entamoeba invadens IP1]
MSFRRCGEATQQQRATHCVLRQSRRDRLFALMHTTPRDSNNSSVCASKGILCGVMRGVCGGVNGSDDYQGREVISVMSVPTMLCDGREWTSHKMPCYSEDECEKCVYVVHFVFVVRLLMILVRERRCVTCVIETMCSLCVSERVVCWLLTRVDVIEECCLCDVCCSDDVCCGVSALLATLSESLTFNTTHIKSALRLVGVLSHCSNDVVFLNTTRAMCSLLKRNECADAVMRSGYVMCCLIKLSKASHQSDSNDAKESGNTQHLSVALEALEYLTHHIVCSHTPSDFIKILKVLSEVIATQQMCVVTRIFDITRYALASHDTAVIKCITQSRIFSMCCDVLCCWNLSIFTEAAQLLAAVIDANLSSQTLSDTHVICAMNCVLMSQQVTPTLIIITSLHQTLHTLNITTTLSLLSAFNQFGLTDTIKSLASSHHTKLALPALNLFRLCELLYAKNQ